MANQSDWKLRILVAAQSHVEGNHKPLDELCKDIIRLQGQQHAQAAEVEAKTPDRNPRDVPKAKPAVAPVPAVPAVAPVVPVPAVEKRHMHTPHSTPPVPKDKDK